MLIYAQHHHCESQDRGCRYSCVTPFWVVVCSRLPLGVGEILPPYEIAHHDYSLDISCAIGELVAIDIP